MKTSENQQELEGIKLYCNLLEELKLRLKSVQSIVRKEASLESFGHPIFANEFVFTQIRKILEIIAFGSMSSNIRLYSDVYRDYQRHWKAVKILEKIEKINKDFYPRPLQQSDEISKNNKFILEDLEDGFLSIDEFIFLYDACSKIIHSPNPYAESKSIDLKLSVDYWMHRVASLLWFHQIRLANSDTSWFVYLIHPETQKSKAIQVMKI